MFGIGAVAVFVIAAALLLVLLACVLSMLQWQWWACNRYELISFTHSIKITIKVANVPENDSITVPNSRQFWSIHSIEMVSEMLIKCCVRMSSRTRAQFFFLCAVVVVVGFFFWLFGYLMIFISHCFATHRWRFQYIRIEFDGLFSDGMWHSHWLMYVHVFFVAFAIAVLSFSFLVWFSPLTAPPFRIRFLFCHSKP